MTGSESRRLAIMISSASIGFADMLADRLRARPDVARVEVPVDVTATLKLLTRDRFDLHFVGGASLDYVRGAREMAASSTRDYFPSGEKVLMMNEPEPFRALLAMEWGFSRVIDMRLPIPQIIDRMVARPGSHEWHEDQIANFPLIDARGSPKLSELCRDSVDIAIVEGIIEGMSDPEIALRINYAVQSVRNRVSRILTTAGCRNRTHFAVSMVRVRAVPKTGT